MYVNRLSRIQSYWLAACWAGARGIVGPNRGLEEELNVVPTGVDLVWRQCMSLSDLYKCQQRITLVTLSASWEGESCQWKENHGKIPWLPFSYRATRITFLKCISLSLSALPKYCSKLLTMPVLPQWGHFDIVQSTFARLFLTLPPN